MVEKKKLSFAEYQSLEGLNQSEIKRILDNPQKWALGYSESPKSEALDFGSLCHDLILSPDEISKKYFITRDIDKLDFRLKEHKNIKSEVERSGLILIDGGTLKRAEALIKANKSTFESYFEKGDFEMSFFGDLQGVKCKARTDFITSKGDLIIDLKIMQSASKDAFSQSVAKFGYHIQAAFYLDLIGAKRFLFLAIEKEPPFMCGIYELSPEAVDLGREKYLKAFEILINSDLYDKNRYFELNKDGTRDEVQMITLPTWAFYKD